MAHFKNFENIQAWELAREIAKDVWFLMENTSLCNDASLKNQINRSSGSIMDNIAEGFERNGNREFIQFLSIAKASCGEVKSQLYRAADRHHITSSQFDNLVNKIDIVSSKLGALISYLSKSERRGSKFTQ